MGSMKVRMNSQGRIVIPADLRRELGFQPGEDLLAHSEGGRLVLETRAQVIERLKAEFRQHVPRDVSLVDELIAERREEARTEAREW